MQLLIFAGEDYYPEEHFGDFRGILSLLEDDGDLILPSADVLSDFFASQPAVTWLGQCPLSRCTWASVLAVDGHSPPRRQGWDILAAPAAVQHPQQYLKQRGCSACWDSRDGWRGIRLKAIIAPFLQPDISA